MRLLFVVHRTYPYNGGSEYNVKIITEELSKRGYDVSVLTDESCGNYGNVKIINDRTVVFKNKYDWIIVHGNDMPIQDFVLLNIEQIKSKVLYWIIKPSDSQSAVNGFKFATSVGWGTSYDYNHVLKYKCENKSDYIRYSVDMNDSCGVKSDKKDRYFLSSGGFGKHKGFDELIEIFSELSLENVNLVLTGYIGSPPVTNNPKISIRSIDLRQDYLNLLSNSDLYIMNSYEEGFGLVLLDAIINKVPWISRNIAGATDLNGYGLVYSSKEELKKLLLTHEFNENRVEHAYQHIVSERTVEKMALDFEKILRVRQ